MRSIYPGVPIKEYLDDSDSIPNKIIDPEGDLVLHVYTFDPLLEAGINEECVGIEEP